MAFHSSLDFEQGPCYSHSTLEAQICWKCLVGSESETEFWLVFWQQDAVYPSERLWLRGNESGKLASASEHCNA